MGADGARLGEVLDRIKTDRICTAKRNQASLLEAVAHNCTCEFGVAGSQMTTCGAHRMLADDQRVLNGLLFGRFLAPRLLREEMDV